MYIDSHCHLNFPEFNARLEQVLATMNENLVTHALCVAVDLPHSNEVLELAEKYPELYASVGVHPDYEDTIEPTVEELVKLACHPKVIGIGETGLDYYRLQGDLEWQRERFRVHIRVSRQISKPLIVHTRAAAEDTLRILSEEGAAPQEGGAGGVMHCFTESLEVAKAALDLGFYISFSGILTFKKATQIQNVARFVPLDRILIETDSPYLAPIPFRGKCNEPGWVRYVGEFLASLKGINPEEVGEQTSANFRMLFGLT